ncbi:S8 family serine peptidase [Kitasatospora sp. NPDC057015]|uniref:S8 family serine peptidase n=1 Tax=Kitasatospora sp. NPDC057015 TaxID=3346001 RepID=UPI0036387919
MLKQSVRRPLSRLGVALALVAGSAAALGVAPAARTGPVAGQVRAAGPATVLLELGTEPAAPAWQRAAGQARRALRSPQEVRREAARAGADQRREAVRALDRLARDVHAAAPEARELYRTQALLAGLAVTAPAERLPALRALPGVRAVHPIARKSRVNAHSVPLTGAPTVWAGAPGGSADAEHPDTEHPDTGQGVRIGIIDSGIDYTHADFGGPGTEAAFRAVDGAKPAPAGLFPNAKVTGGKDLVGDDYDPDPASPTFQPLPRPDGNPIDCARNGHGTHVAGTAAGLGVGADGRPYPGPYRPGLDPAAFLVGPGAAPGAQLYAIRVFGCDGSTDQLTQALDVAADPDGDGDLTDRLDVVNLSLGSRFGNTDDADSIAADRLAALGTVVVASAGNEGDVYGIGGSPGTAPRALTVAASVDAHSDADGLRVLAPDTLAGVVPAHWSSRYQDWAVKDVSGELALPVDQSDGCTAFDEGDRARLAGRIAVLGWQTKESERACGSGARADHAADAGAIGMILAAVDDHLAEIAGNDRIPAVLLARADGERLRAGAVGGAVTVRLATPGNELHGVVAQEQPQRTDTLTDFTSRGIGVPGVVKPDLAAPGETIWSAKAGSGAGGMRESGTSMAAPHMAGLAALVRAAHPEWSVEQVKAALMNTATDTWSGDDHGGPAYGPERTGAGRVRVDLAVRTPAVAHAAGEGAVEGSVGVSFGPVPVGGPLELTREVEVRNLSGGPLAYRTGYRTATELPGAAFALAPDRVVVPAGGAARVTVTLKVPGQLDRTPDPTLDTAQAGRARSYRGELSGLLLLTPDAGDTPAADAPAGPPELRVPLFAAPRPASDITAGVQARMPRTGTLLALTGTAAPARVGGLVSAFALAGEGERWPDCPSEEICVDRPGDRAADLRAAGAATDAPGVPGGPAEQLGQGMLYLAANLWAPATTPVGVHAVRASLDTDGDGVTDAVVAADRLRGSDVLVARTLDARTGRELDVQPLNGRWGDTDTDLLDSDTVVLPVRLAALPGLREGATVVHYGIWTGLASPGLPEAAEAYAAIGLDGVRPTAVLDVLHPALDVRSGIGGPVAALAPERPAGVLEVRRAADDRTRLLLVHHLNPDGRRAQIVDLG